MWRMGGPSPSGENVLGDRRDTRHQFNLMGDPALALRPPRIVSEQDPDPRGGCAQNSSGNLLPLLLAGVFGSMVRLGRRRYP